MKSLKHSSIYLLVCTFVTVFNCDVWCTAILIDTTRRSRSPKLWKNPDEFNPDRFDHSLPDYKKKADQMRVFGGGKKGCIGKGAWVCWILVCRETKNY